jgi:hypothetical protein
MFRFIIMFVSHALGCIKLMDEGHFQNKGLREMRPKSFYFYEWWAPPLIGFTLHKCIKHVCFVKHICNKRDLQSHLVFTLSLGLLSTPNASLF